MIARRYVALISIILIAVVVVLIIPPGLLSVLIHGCAEEQNMCFVPIYDSVEVTRTGPDSIHLVMRPDSGVKHDPAPQMVSILINEKDASNQSMILQSHLDAAIDPPEGLPFRENAAVTLYGRDLSGNETVPVHLQVIVAYPDRGIRYVICDRSI